MPNDLWQMDVTHVPSFGKSSYAHVTVDTFSHFAVASALSGEKLSHVCNHLLHCCSVMGAPESLRTDHGQLMEVVVLQPFVDKIHHETGIPHHPEGQGIAEKLNHLLTTQRKKIKRDMGN